MEELCHGRGCQAQQWAAQKWERAVHRGAGIPAPRGVYKMHSYGTEGHSYWWDLVGQVGG